MKDLFTKFSILYINTRTHLFFNLNNYRVIISFVYLAYLLFNPDILLCDPGDSYFTENSAKELDGKPITYQPYRPGLHQTSDGYRYEMDGRPVTSYQPYRPGLYSTAEGYRYEMESANRHEIGGRAVDYHPESHDATRNVNYPGFYKTKTNDVETASTQLGFMEGETDSEYFAEVSRNNEKLIAIYEANKSIKRPSLFSMAKNFIKNDLEKTRQKASEGRAKTRVKDTEWIKAKSTFDQRQKMTKLERLNELSRRHEESRRSFERRWG